jgi:hypothetical protein
MDARTATKIEEFLLARGMTLAAANWATLTRSVSHVADVDVIHISNLREWQEFCGALRPAATGGPRTPAEINARAAELWPKPKPLVPVWKQKAKGDN